MLPKAVQEALATLFIHEHEAKEVVVHPVGKFLQPPEDWGDDDHKQMVGATDAAYMLAREPYYVHSNDDYGTKTGVRGGVLVIPFRHECGGDDFRICFGFHKGNTYAWAETLR